MDAHSVPTGAYIEYNGSPHLVLRKEVVAVGTHSHSKTKLFLRPLSGGGERQVVMAHHDAVHLLDLQRKSAQVISVGDSVIQIMDNVSYETMDAKPAPDLKDSLQLGDEITFVDPGNAPIIISLRKRNP